jgi:two-component system OmpR family sensor kinase
LRRLRWRLTLLYAGASALGLVALATIATATDVNLRDSQLDNEQKLRATTAASLIYYDGDVLRLDSLREDEVAVGSPQIVVLTGADAPRTVVFTGTDAPLYVEPAELYEVAAGAVHEEGLVRGDATDAWLLALPMYGDGDKPTGAVVAIGDPAPGAAQHRDLVLALALGCVGLIALAGLAGHALSGRSMRPALAALEQQEAFLADAAHDLRTPVTTLRTLAESALTNPDQRDDLLPRVVRTSARMADIVDDLLTRARLSAGVASLGREPLRLDQLVEGVVETADTAAHEVTVSTRPCTVEADAHLITRAVANLLENAFRHGHVPGEPARVEVTVLPTGRVTVADHGPGIDPAIAAALFERFRGGPGSVGLGLSISQWAAHLHGGALTVGANPGGGAVFELTIPPVPAPPAREQGGAAAGGHVLDPAQQQHRDGGEADDRGQQGDTSE